MAQGSERIAVIVTCEHGGNRVPRRYAPLFAGCAELLASHRGWDPGSLDMGRAFAAALDAPLIASTTTRLLVELNRSPHHRALFSKITRPLPRAKRERILRDHYHPHRQQVEQTIEGALAHAPLVVHLAMHTFTPVLDGDVRRTDVGLLFDPSRRAERLLCTRWQAALRQARPDLTVHRNQPYRGVSDGIQTTFRRRWPAARYAAMELEVNQRFAADPRAAWRRLTADLITTCRTALRAM
ncbi:MAG: N-formylglutamate amidohydrolase [Phycisphaerales bacterium]|nr:N-formylglutamate amidohydrolase [Phycisphaerales bacterium]